MDEQTLKKLKIVLRENDCPFFTDEELEFHYEDCGKNFDETAYKCLILKSENTTLNLSGFETGDTSKYWRRLAQRYRPNHSRALGD